MSGSRAALSALTLTLLAPAAHADIPLPAAFGYIAQTWLAMLTLGVSVVLVTLVEGVILQLMLRIGWPRALKLALGANVITTVYGFLFVFGPARTVVLAIVPAVIAFVLGVFRRASRPHTAFLTLVLGLAPIPAYIALVPVMFLDPDAGTPLLFVSLVPAFALTTLIEFAFLRAMIRDRPVIRASVLSNIASYSLIAVALLVMKMRGPDNPMLTPDYYVAMRIPGAIRAGDVPNALRLARIAQDMRVRGLQGWRETHPGYAEDFSYVLQSVGGSLRQSGHFAEAIEVYGWASEEAPLTPRLSQQIAGCIAEARARLTSQEAAAN